MDWNNFINSNVKPEYIIYLGLATEEAFKILEKTFNERILTIESVKKCTKKDVTKLFKVMIASKFERFPLLETEIFGHDQSS